MHSVFPVTIWLVKAVCLTKEQPRTRALSMQNPSLSLRRTESRLTRLGVEQGEASVVGFQADLEIDDGRLFAKLQAFLSTGRRWREMTMFGGGFRGG